MSEGIFGAAALNEYLALAVLTAIGFGAAWLDVRFRRIPNWLCALVAVAGLLSVPLLGEASWALIGSHILHMLIALVAGMILFGVGVFGGGDAKFYAGIAAWFALPEAARLLLMVAVCGLVLLIGWFIYRRLKGYPIRRKTNDPFDALPYGVAIAAGSVTAMFV